MKINKEKIPIKMEGPGTIMRNLPGYGGMTVAFNELPEGTDFAPLLAGLNNDMCHCAHWGYMIEGEMIVLYKDGTEETVTAGDAFYFPPGHTAKITKDAKLVDFSPEAAFDEVMTHVSKKIAAMSNV